MPESPGGRWPGVHRRSDGRERGGSQDHASAIFPAPIEGHIEIDAGGMARVSPENAISYFYNECSTAVAIEAARRLRPTAIGCVAEPGNGEPWRQVPTTYVVCENDRVMVPEFQRQMARNATEVVSLPTDHSPFLSAPQELARLLTAAAL